MEGEKNCYSIVIVEQFSENAHGIRKVASLGRTLRESPLVELFLYFAYFLYFVSGAYSTINIISSRKQMFLLRL